MRTRNLLLPVMLVILCAGVARPRGQDAKKSCHPGDDRFTGCAAPDFELRVLNAKDKTLRLSSLKGKAVLINFWATWCEPCKVEMPWFAQLQEKYGPQGLQILGVAMDDSEEKVITDFARKMGVNYPVLLGTEKMADLYGGVDGLPMTFFVDRSGTITGHTLGLRSESELEEAVQKSLQQGESPKTENSK